MTVTETTVLATCLAAIAWINWYFLFSGQAPSRAVATAGGLQDVRVQIDGGYAPASVEVVAGRPVRLSFTRVDQSSCTEEVLVPDFGIRRFVPTGALTAVEFTPREPGTHEFTCGMGMLRGRIVVTPAEV